MPIHRRQFIVAAASGLALPAVVGGAEAPARPNILWITAEDIGPQLGCYGDPVARTPTLDALAARGMRYRHVWSNAPVCAPARTCLITGAYPPSLGAEHMRSCAQLPPSIDYYPQILRRAGYYCTNNSKTDYNLPRQGQVWDECSARAHYRNRQPGQPFFAIFNFTMTHESGIRRKADPKTDPAKVRVPAYHPDTPEVRRDWAMYYDNIAAMDSAAAKVLAELEQAGLAEDTIVFFYGDHGSGMPRSKRTPCDSGLRVGLIVYVPPRFRRLAPNGYTPGGMSDRLVGFVDLAPTLLSLAGVKPPQAMQGGAIMGPYDARPAQYLFGFRGRMDERYDLVRSVTDGRYVYLRNYMPHRPHGQHVSYQFETRTTQVWKKLFDEGRLNAAQSRFWQPRAPEELYDLANDPDEVQNLADSPEHRPILERLRQAHRAQVARIRDVGFLPEGEIHSRSTGSSPYEMARDPGQYPFERILAAADLASGLKPEALPELRRLLGDADSAVRYWAALGILMRGQAGAEASRAELEKALTDASPYVRAAAAEALCRFGGETTFGKAVAVLLECCDCSKVGTHAAMFALNSLDALGRKAAPYKQTIQALPKNNPAGDPERCGEYVNRLLLTILENLA